MFLLAPADLYKSVEQHAANITIPNHDLAGYLIGVWNIYDTPNYIKIAQDGYGSDPAFLTVFFPGYPLLIKVTAFFLLGNSLLAALLLANIAALIFFWYLYRLVVEDYGPAVARRAVILSATFPSAFFLFLGYTEPLLLACTVTALYYGRRSRWWVAGSLAAAAALIKQPGLFLVVPLGYMYWQARRHRASVDAQTPRFAWLSLLLAPLATAVYSGFRYLYVQAPSQGITDLGGKELLTIPGLPLLRALQVLHTENPLLVVNLLDVCFTLLLIVLAIRTILTVRIVPYVIYTVLLTVASLAVTWPDVWRPEVNMPRRLLLVFPIYIYLARMTPHPRTFRLLVGACFAVFLTLSWLFVHWVFVS